MVKLKVNFRIYSYCVLFLLNLFLQPFLKIEIDTPRPKRRRVAVEKRNQVLDRLKALKGKKNKYDIDEVQNVYDVVDEDEYQNIVADKAQSNWIEEDGKFC